MRASTSDARRSLRRRLALGALGALVLVGCFAATRDDDRKPVRFQHQSHIARGLECADCHGEVQTAGRASMPASESCRECHNDKEKISADVAAAISEYVSRPPEARHPRPKTYADITFAHAAHVGSSQLSCATCHGTLSATQPNPVAALTMNACTDCHRSRSRPLDCLTCHQAWSQAYKPPSHSALWKVRHGEASRATRDVTVARAENCSLCHTRQSCDQCHAIEKPRNHTEAWRTRTHGLLAAMDRTSCTACHQADSCERCHLNAPPPTSHRAGFGAPRDLHCLTCHDELSQSGCSVCHKGTPDHLLAVPKPANHTAGMNCRQCHGHGQPLPHADNGTDCNNCHH